MAEELRTEGPRSFSVLLSGLDDGAVHADVSAKLQAMVVEIAEQARMKDGKIRGSFSLKLDVTVDAKGVAEVAANITVKTPPRKRSPSTVWVTKGGNLTTEIPRQEPLFGKPRAVPDAPPDNQQRPAAKDA